MTARLALALFVTVFAVQAPSFEGRLRMRTINLQVEEDETNATLDAATQALAAREDAQVDSATLMIKGNMLRTSRASDAEGYALWDLARHTMSLVQPADRAYMEVPLPAGTNTARPGAGAARGPAPRSLGARTINGMKTTGYEIRDGDVIVRGWMTTDHPGLTWAFRTAISQRDEDEEEDFEDAATDRLAQYGFPVVLYTLRQGGLQVEEIVAVERVALGADLFKVPAGYRKKELGGP